MATSLTRGAQTNECSEARSASTEASADERGSCLVLLPGSPEDEMPSLVRRVMVREIIRPALRQFGYRTAVNWETTAAGSITLEKVNRLLTEELMIADLSDANPNIMYALAARHASGLPVVQIINETTSMPFDFDTASTIRYREDMAGMHDLGLKVRGAVEGITEDDIVSAGNPLYRAREEKLAEERRREREEDEEDRPVLDELRKVEGLIDRALGSDGDRKSASGRAETGSLFPRNEDETGRDRLLLQALRKQMKILSRLVEGRDAQELL